MAIAIYAITHRLKKGRKKRCIEFQVWLWNKLAMKCSYKSSTWFEWVFGIYILIYYSLDFISCLTEFCVGNKEEVLLEYPAMLPYCSSSTLIKCRKKTTWKSTKLPWSYVLKLPLSLSFFSQDVLSKILCSWT